MRFLLALLLFSPAVAQPFQIVPSRAPSGGGGSLLTTLQSPSDKEPVALQWTIAFGPGVRISEIVAGDAGTKAGKTLHCAKPDKTIEETYNCLIAGGTSSISNGTLFVVRYTVKPDLKPQVVPVKLSGAIAVLQVNGRVQRIDLDPAEGTITIQ